MDLQKILAHLPQDHHRIFQKVLRLRQERGVTNASDMVDDAVVRGVMLAVRNPDSLSRVISLNTHPDKSQEWGATFPQSAQDLFKDMFACWNAVYQRGNAVSWDWSKLRAKPRRPGNPANATGGESKPTPTRTPGGGFPQGPAADPDWITRLYTRAGHMAASTFLFEAEAAIAKGEFERAEA